MRPPIFRPPWQPSYRAAAPLQANVLTRCRWPGGNSCALFTPPHLHASPLSTSTFSTIASSHTQPIPSLHPPPPLPFLFLPGRRRCSSPGLAAAAPLALSLRRIPPLCCTFHQFAFKTSPLPIDITPLPPPAPSSLIRPLLIQLCYSSRTPWRISTVCFTASICWRARYLTTRTLPLLVLPPPALRLNIPRRDGAEGRVFFCRKKLPNGHVSGERRAVKVRVAACCCSSFSLSCRFLNKKTTARVQK